MEAVTGWLRQIETAGIQMFHFSDLLFIVRELAQTYYILFPSYNRNSIYNWGNSATAQWPGGKASLLRLRGWRFNPWLGHTKHYKKRRPVASHSASRVGLGGLDHQMIAEHGTGQKRKRNFTCPGMWSLLGLRPKMFSTQFIISQLC